MKDEREILVREGKRVKERRKEGGMNEEFQVERKEGGKGQEEEERKEG